MSAWSRMAEATVDFCSWATCEQIAVPLHQRAIVVLNSIDSRSGATTFSPNISPGLAARPHINHSLVLSVALPKLILWSWSHWFMVQQLECKLGDMNDTYTHNQFGGSSSPSGPVPCAKERKQADHLTQFASFFRLNQSCNWFPDHCDLLTFDTMSSHLKSIL